MLVAASTVGTVFFIVMIALTFWLAEVSSGRALAAWSGKRFVQNGWEIPEKITQDNDNVDVA